MPAKVTKRGGKWRVIEPGGDLVKRGGSPVDGGGHDSRSDALAQAAAINSSERSKSRAG